MRKPESITLEQLIALQAAAETILEDCVIPDPINDILAESIKYLRHFLQEQDHDISDTFQIVKVDASGLPDPAHRCAICKRNWVNSDEGFDTCVDCMSKQ